MATRRSMHSPTTHLPLHLSERRRRRREGKEEEGGDMPACL